HPQGITGPIALAPSQTHMYTSDYCGAGQNTPFRNIKSISCNGTATVVTAVPTLFGATCEEMYMAFAPLQSLIAGFTPRDVFITRGPLLYRFPPPNPPTPLPAPDVLAVIPPSDRSP